MGTEAKMGVGPSPICHVGDTARAIELVKKAYFAWRFVSPTQVTAHSEGSADGSRWKSMVATITECNLQESVPLESDLEAME